MNRFDHPFAAAKQHPSAPAISSPEPLEAKRPSKSSDPNYVRTTF